MQQDNPRFKDLLHVPRMKPFSNDTWEVQGSLDGSEEQSATVSLVFPGQCRIVGILPTLCLNQIGDVSGLLVPTTDDIMVSLNFNQQRQYTNQIGQTAQALRGQSFVTLTALDTRIRDLNLIVDSARPQMSAQFRWKRFIQATPLYPDQIVALALMVEIDD